MNHLEYDWETPIWRHVFRGLSRGHTLVRFSNAASLSAPIGWRLVRDWLEPVSQPTATTRVGRQREGPLTKGA